MNAALYNLEAAADWSELMVSQRIYGYPLPAVQLADLPSLRSVTQLLLRSTDYVSYVISGPAGDESWVGFGTLQLRVALL